MRIQNTSKSITGYNNINLASTQAERDAFQSMLGKFDADVIEALEVINNYGLNISFEELGKNTDGNNINGQAEVGGDKIKLDKDLLSDPSKLKDVFAHELAHILGGSHETSAEEDTKFDALVDLLTNDQDDQGYILDDVFANYRALQEAQSQDVSESENHMEKEKVKTQKKEKVKTPKETSGKTSDNEGVTVSEMTTSNDGKVNLSGIKEGDQMVVIMTISGDLPPELNGFEVAYDKGAANGKNEMRNGEADLRTVVLTKTATAKDAKKGDISYDFGKNASTQAFSVSGGKIDIGNVAEHAGDSKGQKTTIDANKNKDAAFYLNVASADDPANYKKGNIKNDSGVVSFASSVSGDDSGASWITTDNDGSSISYDKVGGGDNDHGLSFAIVKN